MKTRLSKRQAQEFIAAAIADEARRAGCPLSETERKMLFFSEGAANARDFAEVLDAFHRECDGDEYERRIASLIKASRDRAGKESATWSAAFAKLKATDSYLGAMIDVAGVDRSSAVSSRDAVAIAIVVGALVLFILAIWWYLGHPPTRGELFFYTWLGAMVFALTYLAGRVVLGAERLDALIGRAIDSVWGTSPR